MALAQRNQATGKEIREGELFKALENYCVRLGTARQRSLRVLWEETQKTALKVRSSKVLEQQVTEPAKLHMRSHV